MALTVLDFLFMKIASACRINFFPMPWPWNFESTKSLETRLGAISTIPTIFRSAVATKTALDFARSICREGVLKDSHFFAPACVHSYPTNIRNVFRTILQTTSASWGLNFLMRIFDIQKYRHCELRRFGRGEAIPPLFHGIASSGAPRNDRKIISFLPPGLRGCRGRRSLHFRFPAAVRRPM